MKVTIHSYVEFYFIALFKEIFFRFAPHKQTILRADPRGRYQTLGGSRGLKENTKRPSLLESRRTNCLQSNLQLETLLRDGSDTTNGRSPASYMENVNLMH